MVLATDTTVYLNRRGEALKVHNLTFTICASDLSRHPGLPAPSVSWRFLPSRSSSPATKVLPFPLLLFYVSHFLFFLSTSLISSSSSVLHPYPHLLLLFSHVIFFFFFCTSLNHGAESSESACIHLFSFLLLDHTKYVKSHQHDYLLPLALANGGERA